MNQKISDYMLSYGGKAGVLQYLHDYHPELRKYLVPMQIVPYGGEISQDIYKTLLKSREIYESPNMIVRPSHPKDRFGMVDFLPTKIVEDKEYYRSANFWNNNRKQFQKTLWEVLDKLFSNKRKYLDETKFILSPYVPHQLYTVTEHPNYDKYLIIDFGKQGTLLGRGTTHIINEKIIGYEGTLQGNSVLRIKNLIEELRALEVFYGSDKLQYEIGFTPKGKVYLFQVKKFSDTFASPPKEFIKSIDILARFFGNYEIAINRLYGSYHTYLDEIRQLEHISQKEVLFSCEVANHYPSLEDPLNNLKGFICCNQSLLFHNLTAPTQAVLQNNGFALLNQYGPTGLNKRFIKAFINKNGELDRTSA